MPHHVLYCIDTPTNGTEGPTRLAGWCLGSRPIEAMEMHLPGGTVEVSYGQGRPDVAAAYDRYPNAAASGFAVEVPAGSLRNGEPIDCTVTVRERLRCRRYPLQLRPSSNGVQQVDLHPDGYSGFDPDTLEDELRRSLARRPGLVLRLDIINKCNLRCIMCSYSDPEVFGRPMKKVRPEEFRTLFEDLAGDVRTVVLSCADEPLTSNYFPDILSYLVDEHPHVDVEFCTNAMLMNAKIRRLLIEKGVGHLMLSMDGSSKATLESIRVGAKYERIVANIKALRDLKRAAGARYPILVMDFIMMSRNVHEAPAFVELSSRLGVRMIDFRHVIPGYMNDPEEMLCHHRARYNHYREQVLKAAARLKVDVTIPPPYETPEVFDPAGDPVADLAEFDAITPDPAKGEAPVPRRFPRGFKSRHPRGTAAEHFAGTYCPRPFSEVMVAEQDLVRPCPWYRGHLGRLSEGKTLHDVFFGPKARELRRNMLRPEGDPGCQGCPLKAEYLASEARDFSGAYSRFGVLGTLVKRGLAFLRPVRARG